MGGGRVAFLDEGFASVVGKSSLKLDLFSHLQ
jgi:hypothetical protein